MNRKVERFLKSLNPAELNEVYHYIQYGYVKQDIINTIKDTAIYLTEEQIDEAADIYVDEGGFDMNINYWDNIQHAINLVREQ